MAEPRACDMVVKPRGEMPLLQRCDVRADVLEPKMWPDQLPVKPNVWVLRNYRIVALMPERRLP